MVNSKVVSTIGKVAPVFTVVNGTIDFAGKIYDAVDEAKNAPDGEGVKAFFKGLLGKNDEGNVLNGIQSTLNQVDSKIDDIADSIDDLSTQLDTVIGQLNTLLANLDSGVADIKVNLYQSQLQMQEWTTTYTQINNFYTKYSDVRTTLQTTIKTLEARAADYDAFLEAVSSQSNGDEINAALAKLDIACSNYDSLTDSEKELLNTVIEFNGSSYTVYGYVKDYSEYTLNLLEDTYDGFASGYSTDMYMTLQNMADFILGQKWQNGGNGGIGEVYYKLAVMSCSNSEEAHEEYKKFVAGVQYDFLLTAYVCALSLKSQIAYNEQMNVNYNETATYREYLNSIDELMERVLIYSDYEYKYCVQKYDFDGFVPDGNLTYDDFIVYYANPTNYVNMGITKTYFASRKAASHDGNVYVSNASPVIAVGEYDKIRVWFNGKEIQSDYELISGDKCVLIEDDGTVMGVHPGSAKIYMEVDGNRYPIAVVSVSSSFASYTGSDTDRYIWFEDGVEKSITCTGQGYDYEYCVNLFMSSDVMDTGSDSVHTITDYVEFDGTTIGDYDIALNHRYGKKNSADSSVLQFSHQYIGSVSLVRTVDGRKSITVIPIKNSAAIAFDNEVNYTKEEGGTFYIYTKEDLIEWANIYGTGDLTRNKINVKLMADIDFEWGEWKGVENALLEYEHYTNGIDWSLGNFLVKTYTFDGNGHTIKNINFVPTPTELYSYTNSATGVRETKKVVTWGFFSKMSGTLKNLTIENVKYSYYPTDYSAIYHGWTYGSETIGGEDCPLVMSVFASLANSEVHNSSHNYEWVCEINNCVASGISENVLTDCPVYYDPFGMLMDNLDGKTEQEIAIKNCVYDMDYSFAAGGSSLLSYIQISGWHDETERIFTIFNTCESNIFSGSADIYVSSYLNHQPFSVVRTEEMTESEIAKAKDNIRVLPSDTVSEYTLSAAEANNPEFWTSRGWSEQGVKRYMAGSSYPTNHGGFNVDISNLKHYYHIGEAFDKENLIVYDENGDRITNYRVSSVDTSTAGTKTVKVTYGDDYATFTVEYVGFVDVRFEYEDTVHIRSAATGTSIALPDALFTRNDGYWQTGWHLEDDQTGDPLSFGSKVTVTAPVTYVPSWEMGEMCTVVFGSDGVGADIIYNVPAGTKIIVPSFEGMYNPNSHTASSWMSNDVIAFLSPGTEYTVTESVRFFPFTAIKYHDVAINVYFQNLENDDYTFMGTHKQKIRYNGLIEDGFGYACRNLLDDYNLSEHVVKVEAENCVLDEYYGKHRIINGDSSATIWVDRPICSVTWKDVDGNEIKTETLRYGAMPTAPTDEEVGVPAGYTPAWDKEIAAVKGDTVYSVASFVPKDGIEYTVNHMWQNVENDEYTLHESETLTGTTEADTAATAKDYSGFTAKQITQVAIAGDGSTVVNVYYDRNMYTVTWDIEGTTTQESYRYGATPSYKGETPTKPSNGTYDYTFSGWGELAPVTESVTYTAQFDSELCEYTITWDIDGVQTTETYTYGDIPEYKGETPVRVADQQYSYTFRDWGEITAVTGDKTYTANFDATLNKYTITWNVEGDVFTEEYTYGEIPQYKGVTPVKSPDASGSYTFNGWGQIEPVTGDKTYTALFISTTNSYTITWDVNGEKLTELYKYGETPSYKGVTPVKPATAQYSYTFAGWGEITEVTGNKTYTAQFTETVNKYTITWNIDGNQVTEEYEYGAMPSYKGETPAREADAQYTYSFRDWGTILTVTGDKTYTATFNTTVNKYNITWIIDGIQFTESYDYGAMPAYKGYTPTKDATAQYTYTFAGWGEIVKVTGNKTYTAIFDSTVNKYTITWVVNGEEITEEYEYGAMPSYKGETPVKESNAQYTYTFDGFGSILSVTGDKTYTAQFKETVNKYTIKWVVNGEETTEEYEYGATPSYKGETPSKESNGQTAYTFAGWGEITTVTGDKTYTAIFHTETIKYTITWVIGDTQITEKYEYGQTPSYKGETPVKQNTAQYTYTFDGWGDIATVTGDKTYTAKFSATVNKYTITWNIEGTLTEEEYEYGKTPSYKGATPTKDATAQYTYTFKDWGNITAVTGDATYTATFDRTVNKYSITWVINDAQFTEEYEYGATPVYKGYKPTKPATEQYTYTFAGWGEITKVTGDKTYTAVFDKVVNKYTITWDVDGVKTTEEYLYGETPSYKGETPTREDNDKNSYAFIGWGQIEKVTCDKTYTAQFSETTNTYTITWNIDGEKTTEVYPYGATPSYKGEAPTKPATAQYTYTFAGWGEIGKVTGNKTYTAIFEATVNKYTITWNVNGEKTTEEYEYGKTPSYKGATPSKDATAQYSYAFAGWGEITEVTGNKTYTAIFNPTVNKYTITWNVNGEKTTEEYEYGATPSYKGETPSKDATAQYSYTFAGWGEITEVTGNKTYTAQFTETVNKYTITWNIDGKLTEEEYEYGKTPSYKGATPSRDATAQYTYTFKDWGTITKVTDDKTYTAVFTSTVNKYTITWDVNGEKFTEEYEYGATPVYKGYMPTKPATEQYTYTFAGWGEITKVTGDKTYTAIFDATYIVPEKITSSTYNVGEDTISKIDTGTTVEEFIAAIRESQYCKVFKGSATVSDDTTVGTGMTVGIMDGDKTNASYTIIVTGDTNGDGNITITDMLAIKAHVLGKTELTGAYAVAADTNGDGAITITDFLQLKAQLLGKGDIEAR